jgi:Outer membrane protein beta-barrel family
MKKLFLLLFVFCSTHLFAQKISITGIVADGDGKAMENATVLLLAASDSSLVSFGRTKANGTFELKNASLSAACFLKLTFVGYEPYFQDIAKDTKPTTGNTLELGGIRMTPLSKILNEAVVKAERDPVKINGDTTEFNASSFKVQPNATTEDLIKKLPGMEVDRNGNVKAQGEAVTQILVNGKKFFGKDPKIAMQNLPAGAVDKVKVYDKRSDQADFSGIDDGEREKTIDIQLKKDYSQGTFGNGTLGGGGDDKNAASRYLGKFAINSFSKTQQLSFLGNGNNINQTGFSMEDYAGFTGASRQMAGGGGVRISSDNTNGVPLDMGGTKGFLKTWSGGVNYNKTFSKKTELNMSYFFNDQISDNRRMTDRENFLSNGSFLSKSTSNSLTENKNHRLNLTLDQKIDTFTSLKLTSTVSMTDNTGESTSTSENKRGDAIQNSGKNINITEGGGMSAQNSLLLRRRFMKKGRTVSANLFYNYNQSTSNSNLDALQVFYRNGIPKDTTTYQDDDRTNNRSNYGATVSFTEPLGKRQYLEANYSYSATVNEADREVYRLVNKERTTLNTNLSNQYINDYNYQRTGLTYRINKKEWNFSTGAQYQHSSLKGKFITTGTEVQRPYDFILPNLRFEYSPIQGKRATFSYETSVREPSITQLQPIRDNTDPLYISRGNPDLKPEYNNRFRVGYMHFNQATFSALFSNLSVNYTTDKITNAQTIDTALRRSSQPINVRNDVSSNGFIGYNVPLIPQVLRLDTRTNFNFGRGISLINNTDNLLNTASKINSVENLTNRVGAGLTLRLTLTVKDSFDFSVGGTVSHNRTSYSIQSTQNQKYNIYDLETDMNWRLPLGLKLNGSFTYNVIKGNTFGTSTGIPLLGAGISKYMLKQNRGELKFQMVDILNKNQGLTRSADVNYIQEERVASLGRYAMLSFTYAFNPMGGMFGGGRGGRSGGMRMMIREN